MHAKFSPSIGWAASLLWCSCAANISGPQANHVIYNPPTLGPGVAVLHSYNELGDTANTIRINSVDGQKLDFDSAVKLVPVLLRPGKHKIEFEYSFRSQQVTAQIEFKATADKDYQIQTNDLTTPALLGGQRSIDFWVSDVHSHKPTSPAIHILLNG